MKKRNSNIYKKRKEKERQNIVEINSGELCFSLNKNRGRNLNFRVQRHFDNFDRKGQFIILQLKTPFYGQSFKKEKRKKMFMKGSDMRLIENQFYKKFILRGTFGSLFNKTRKRFFLISYFLSVKLAFLSQKFFGKLFFYGKNF